MKNEGMDCRIRFVPAKWLEGDPLGQRGRIVVVIDGRVTADGYTMARSVEELVTVQDMYGKEVGPGISEYPADILGDDSV